MRGSTNFWDKALYVWDLLNPNDNNSNRLYEDNSDNEIEVLDCTIDGDGIDAVDLSDGSPRISKKVGHASSGGARLGGFPIQLTMVQGLRASSEVK